MEKLVSLSAMVEIPHLQAKRKFVMPAQAGIRLVNETKMNSRQKCAGTIARALN